MPAHNKNEHRQRRERIIHFLVMDFCVVGSSAAAALCVYQLNLSRVIR
jgi:hypothetical protein